MVNSSLDENSNLSKEGYDRTSMEVAVGEMEQNSELVELFPEPVRSDVPLGDLIARPKGYHKEAMKCLMH